MRTPRVLLAALLLTSLATQVQGHLTADATFPVGPIALDGTSSITLKVGMECSNIHARPAPSNEFNVALSVAGMPLNITGPAQATFTRTECVDPTASVEREVTYTIAGDAFLPGLVPINVTFTATMPENAVGDIADPLDPVVDTGLVTPAAIFNVRADAFGQVEPTAGGATVTTTVTNAGNVDVTFQVATSPSSHGTAGTLAAVMTERTVARATSATAPSTTKLTLTYTAPANGTGTDRFIVTLQPTIDLDASLPVDSIVLQVAFPYKTVVSGGSTTVEVQASGSVDNPGTSTFATTQGTPGAGVALVLLGLGLAFRVVRRNP